MSELPQQASEHARTPRESRVRARILLQLRHLAHLPVMPYCVKDFAHAIDRGKRSPSELAQVIGGNPLLYERLELILNSAYYAVRFHGVQGIGVRSGIAELGPETVRDILRSLGVVRAFQISGEAAEEARKQSTLPPEECGKALGDLLDVKDFWRHGIAVGLTAQIVVKFTRMAFPAPSSIVFQAGLCHDIGKLLLAIGFPIEFSDVIEFARQRQLMCLEAEQELLHTDHEELGFELGSQFELPESVLQVIACMHHADRAAGGRFEALVRLIQLADYICNHQAIGYTGNHRVLDFPRESFEFLKLNVNDIPRIIEQVRETPAHVDEFLRISYYDPS